MAAQYKHVIDALRDPFPEIARMLIDAEPDLTAFAAFPREHWTKIRPQQPHRAPQPGDQAPSRRRPGLPRQRLRTPPDRIRPVRATEEWQYGERRYLSQTSLRRLTDMLQADNSAGAGGRPALPAITT